MLLENSRRVTNFRPYQRGLTERAASKGPAGPRSSLGAGEKRTQSCFPCPVGGQGIHTTQMPLTWHLNGPREASLVPSRWGATGLLGARVGEERTALSLGLAPSPLRGGGACSHLTLKSMPTVARKVPDRKASSLNWIRKQVLPTPESPRSIT